MSDRKKKFVFGPVPSRRLGLSLGVDIVPLKSCTLDCVYCQLGRSSDLTIERRAFVDIKEVARQIKARLNERVRVDHITISGSGEPTLNIELGKLIEDIKTFTSVPVAIMTNGTLLSLAEVRRDCGRADVVLPSLDAGDARTFAAINRPHSGMHFDAIVEGLVAFRKGYAGQIWLEVFVIEGVNTSDTQLASIHDIIGRIRPDKVQLNTAVRPTTEPGIKAISPDKMTQIAVKIGFGAEVIADFDKQTHAAGGHGNAQSVLEMLARRPCSLEDIASGLGIEPAEALEYVTALARNGKIISQETNGVLFYTSK